MMNTFGRLSPKILAGLTIKKLKLTWKSYVVLGSASRHAVFQLWKLIFMFISDTSARLELNTKFGIFVIAVMRRDDMFAWFLPGPSGCFLQQASSYMIQYEAFWISKINKPKPIADIYENVVNELNKI